MASIQASESSPPRKARTRRYFSRTVAPARWPEYGRLLKMAIGSGYQVVTLEDFLDGILASPTAPTLILRHDVDQHPRSALTMSDIEVSLGVRSIWYFRWRTADREVIEELRRRGGEIGFHYETLSREAIEGKGTSEHADGDLEAARDRLREEIATFAELFGPIRSVAAHGDTRVPEIRNGDLMRDQDWREFGVEYDANDAMRRHRLAAWLTDRSVAEGSWGGGMDPHALIFDRQSPILCLTHPNNWTSGPSLWVDRIVAELTRRTLDSPPSATSPKLPRSLSR